MYLCDFKNPIMLSAFKLKSHDSLYIRSRYSSSWPGDLWVKKIIFLFPLTLICTPFWKGGKGDCPEVTGIQKFLNSIGKILNFSHWSLVMCLTWIQILPSYNWLHSLLFSMILYYYSLWKVFSFPLSSFSISDKSNEEHDLHGNRAVFCLLFFPYRYLNISDCFTSQIVTISFNSDLILFNCLHCISHTHTFQILYLSTLDTSLRYFQSTLQEPVCPDKKIYWYL